jgi:hypothetical protein
MESILDLESISSSTECRMIDPRYHTTTRCFQSANVANISSQYIPRCRHRGRSNRGLNSASIDIRDDGNVSLLGFERLDRCVGHCVGGPPCRSWIFS